MKKNIALVGFGRAGQRFFEHLKKKNNIKIIKIIVKTKRVIFFRDKNIGGTFADIKNLDDLDGVVIATNFKSSFKYAEYFLKKKIPILIEKPFCETLSQSKKIENLFKKNQSSFLINYSDTFDPKFIQLISKGMKKIGAIKSIIGNYGNNKTLYPVVNKYHPIQNWISHPISMFLKICGDITKFKIIKYKLEKKNGFFFQKVQVQLYKKKLNLIFNFSNYPGIKNRNVKIIGSKGYFKFNSYNSIDNYIFYKKKIYIKSTVTPIENIFSLFIKSINKNSVISNLDIGIKEHFLSNAILKKTLKIKKII
ncbi:Gfo/Idh/MocA family oxidoreductase [Pelagibacteraceae bacterium]|nr:Gfo/Idh/MocA family oxidoreductase [Pelagibacteraceae bacterium]